MHLRTHTASTALRCKRQERSRAGLAMVELSLLIAIVGVVLAVGIPTFLRTVRISRISEAAEQLDRMYLGVAAYYGSLQLVDGQRRIGCLPPSAGPTPAVPTPAGVELDFFQDDLPGAETWRALDFNPEGIVRYSYSFLPAQDGCEPPDPAPRVLVTWRAQGDLDGDGELSMFERSASVVDGELVPDALLLVYDRTE